MDFWCNLLKGALVFKDRKSWTRSNSDSFEDGSETVEVKMPIATTRKASVSLQQRQKNSGQPIPPQQFITKKLPQSEDLRDTNLNGTHDAFEDVSFLRLPEVKAVTGTLKDEPLCNDSGKELSCARSPGPAFRCMGKVRSQAVGRRARACVAVGCLIRLRGFLRLRRPEPQSASVPFR